MLIALFAAALSFQEPQPGLAMAERISAHVEGASVAECDAALTEADVGNAEALFTGASICTLADRDDDATFLILAAQARAMADIALVTPENLPPADENGVVDLSDMPQPPFGVLDLYAFIYAYGGGAGPTELYRDRERTDRLFARLESWAPLRPDGYTPGWEGSRMSDDATYSASIRAQVAAREAQLAQLATLYRDDRYWALQVELEALMVANGNSFEAGTPAGDRFTEIQSEQQAIAERLGVSL